MNVRAPARYARRVENETKLTAGDAELTLEPGHGCRIASLRVAGTELLRQGDRFGAFLMVPWAGRTENGVFRNGGVTHQLPVDAPPHAIHGTVYLRTWEPVPPDGPGECMAWTTALGPDWPFAGTCRQDLALFPDRLEQTVEVLADEPMPVSVGWHPWFLRGAAA